MPDEEVKPAPFDEVADVVVEDALGKHFTDHDMSDADDAQHDDDPEAPADRDQEPGDAEPAQPRARRRVAPRLVRDLLTYVDDRYTRLFRAVADGCESVVLIQRGLGPFIVQSRAPTIVLVQDDAEGEVEEPGFDAISISTYARRCSGAVLVLDARDPEPYLAAVAMTAGTMKAGTMRHVLLIQTRPGRQQAWSDLLRAAKPRIEIVVQAVPWNEAAP